MKTIISASRRTDIPAYYLNWFIDAIHKKGLAIPNPLYRHKIIQVDLRPDSVEWIVFWSRNYEKLIKHRSEFSDFQLFFHFTILSYDERLEKLQISFKKSIDQMERLVHHYGAERIIWRYDPIVVWIENKKLYTNFNPGHYLLLSKKLSAMGIRSCYISFATPYHKYLRRINKKYPTWNLSDVRINEEKQKIKTKIKSIAFENSINLFSCCDDTQIDDYIQKGSCISWELLNFLSGEKKVSIAKTPTRPDCGCTRSIDIGDYILQPCYNGCIYCYANPIWQDKASNI